MANHYFDTDNVVAGTALAMGIGDNLFIDRDVSVGSTGAGNIFAVTSGGSATVNVLGTLFSVSGTGFLGTGGSHFLTIGDSGYVWGRVAAIGISDGGTSILNDGTISGRNAGIVISGAGNSINNTGIINASFGKAIAIDPDGATGENAITNSGTIASSGNAAIDLVTVSSGGASLILNSGTIAPAAGFFAIGSGDAQCIIFNTGHIGGAVIFGSNSDVYDGALGTIDGAISGDSGDDELTTGAGRDRLIGGFDADRLDGGQGRDVFFYTAAAESPGEVHDTILAFDFRKDRFVFGNEITAIDATVNGGKLSANDFNNDLVDAIGAAQLGANHAALFKPDDGSFAGHTFLIVDLNGVAGYQKGNKDVVVDLSDPENLGSLDVTDFVGV